MSEYVEFCIVGGNPREGFKVWGPFDNREDASRWARANFENEDWWIMTLQDPAQEDQ